MGQGVEGGRVGEEREKSEKLSRNDNQNPISSVIPNPHGFLSRGLMTLLEDLSVRPYVRLSMMPE